MRYAPLLMDRLALQKSQYWSHAEREAYQAYRLCEAVVRARAFDFWKVRLQSSVPTQKDLTWFSKIPTVSKGDFTQSEESAYTWGTRDNIAARDFTSGSTGKPFSFYLDAHHELRSYAICDRMFRAAGGNAPAVSMRAIERMGVTISRNRFFFLRGYTSVRYRVDALREFLRKFPQGVVLFGFSSSVIELARIAKERSVELPLRGVVAGGEALTDAQRREIESGLGLKPRLSYSTRELGWLGFECEEGAMHIHEEWAFVEILDTNGKTVCDGDEGEIVVTTFDNRIMPFIRYRTGDRGVVSSAACSCGRTLRTIRVLGRTVEIISFEDGRKVSLLDFSPIFDRYTKVVRQFQIVQTDTHAFDIKVIPGPSFDMFQEELVDRIRMVIHPKAIIRWEIVAEIPEGPNGKARYFIPLQRTRTA